MSYQVLARKWRPRFFDEMVGQEHVLRALINALNNQKLHHAYLFTGTRGVGKTTIARILAKCLNCEQGISARPCGQCSACKEIAEGRFVDLIEVDAASRTKVEDTRELLDNVQYAPTRGRFKVYLIDEVHMLSTHSFNALLKTLEEPPEHVKFLLATTDPQKLPVTVLSRCLQFNLKNMTAERIVGHLKHVLAEEQVQFEEPALWQLGRAAHGSMRDALSLTDQAIAYGEGLVGEAQVNAMLGTMDRGRLFKLAELMAKANASDVMAEVAAMAEHAPDYDEVLQGLLSLWHRVALAQVVPNSVDNSEGEQAAIMALAGAMQPEDLQLYYQIGVSGRQDLALAPEPRQGFEMLLLRMLAFCPAPAAPVDLDLDTALQKKKPVTAEITASAEVSSAPQAVTAEPVTAPVPAPVEKTSEPDEELLPPWLEDELAQESVQSAAESEPQPELQTAAAHTEPAPTPSLITAAPVVPEDSADTNSAELPILAPHTWWQWAERLPLGGLVQMIAYNLALVRATGQHYEFELDPDQSTLYNETHQLKIQEALNTLLPEASIQIELKLPSYETPAQREKRLKTEAFEQAEAVLSTDNTLAELLNTFNAKIVEGSIRPVH